MGSCEPIEAGLEIEQREGSVDVQIENQSNPPLSANDTESVEFGLEDPIDEGSEDTPEGENGEVDPKVDESLEQTGKSRLSHIDASAILPHRTRSRRKTHQSDVVG